MCSGGGNQEPIDPVVAPPPPTPVAVEIKRAGQTSQRAKKKKGVGNLTIQRTSSVQTGSTGSGVKLNTGN